MRILVREQPKKRNNNKKPRLQPTGFAWILYIDTFVGKCNGAQARRGVRGPPGPTIIIIKEIIRFNNNNNNLFYSNISNTLSAFSKGEL